MADDAGFFKSIAVAQSIAPAVPAPQSSDSENEFQHLEKRLEDINLSIEPVSEMMMRAHRFASANGLDSGKAMIAVFDMAAATQTQGSPQERRHAFLRLMAGFRYALTTRNPTAISAGPKAEGGVDEPLILPAAASMQMPARHEPMRGQKQMSRRDGWQSIYDI